MPRRRKPRTTREVFTLIRKQEDGRPQGTLKRFDFEQTRIGFMLRYEMPMVYFLLRRLCPVKPFCPEWSVIEALARASQDASYRKAKFRRYLDEYRRKGLYCRRGKQLTPQRKAYYETMRRKKMKEYIRINRRRIEACRNIGQSQEQMLREIKSIIKTERTMR